jgi:hypothetical protein
MNYSTLRMGRRLTLALTALLALTSGLQAQGRFDGRPQNISARTPRGERPNWQPPPGWRDSRSSQRPFERPPESVEVSAGRGYFFLDGEYIEGPYKIRRDGTSVTVNGRALPEETVRDLRHSLASPLENDSVVVAFAEQPVVALDQMQAVHFLTAIISDEDQKETDAVLKHLPDTANKDDWRLLLTSYEAPEPLASRARTRVDETKRVLAEGQAAIAATQRLRNFAYPLTICGMIFSVAALGHVLRSAPQRLVNEAVAQLRGQDAVISIVWVLLLSGLDLTWTLLASQAGQMQELNPLGSQLIHDPWLLSAFKIGFTIASCALLVALRKHHRAQIAAWWVCLILTVLTFRWLVLNSLFVA